MGMGLVDPIASSESPKTASELASITGADKQLIGTPISHFLPDT